MSREAVSVSPRRSPWSGLLHVEGLFNAAGHQRGGLLWGLLRLHPELRRGHPVVRELSSGAFGTNPVLASYLIALLSKRCEPAGDGEEGTADLVERVRGTLAPLLASVGDRIFWGGVRPAVSLAAILSVLLGWGEPALWILLVYNGASFYWRRRGWRTGSAGEEAVREEIKSRDLERSARRWNAAARFLLGVTIGAALAGQLLGGGVRGAVLLAALLGTGILLSRLRRLSPLLLSWIGIGGAGLLVLLHYLTGRRLI